MKEPMNSRRQFLRSGSALIALPFLESFGFRRFASAANKTPAPPKRMVFLGMGYGVTEESWFPSEDQPGPDYELPPGLRALERHRADFTIVQRLTNRWSREGHAGSTFWLTGANQFEGGATFRNTISADQVAAAQFGRFTRFPSIQLNGADPDMGQAGHGPGLSMAWDRRGKPVAGLNSPLALFHRLFSPDNTPLKERRQLLEQKRSVLDAVLADARDLQRGLATRDVKKLDEYFDSIRDIETRLVRDEDWQSVPIPKAPIAAPPASPVGRAEIEVMYDLMIAAMQTDSTRVLTYRQPISTLLTSLGIQVAAHDMSHYTPGERKDASQRRDVALSELLAGFLDRLKATEEADGSSLFDHVSLVFGSNLRTVHQTENCPTILSGRGAGVKLGHNLVMPKDTPLCNAWLTLLHGVGVQVNRHGDSTGLLKEIIA
ncbi:MAG: hypothetical protein CMJ78_13060 [Planctomycetaceae bacterium]|nr:hypothetical protein [Planctomycetaceae bacterium]